MAAQSVRVPYQYFTNQDGTALDNGRIYIGAANQDPVSNPIQVYWDDELTIPASQPISTNAGFPVYQGTPANVYADQYAYSITVKDSGGQTVYTDQFVINDVLSSATLAELPDAIPAEGRLVFLTNPGREGWFICRTGIAPLDPLHGIYVSSNTPNFYWERDWDGITGYADWFGAVIDNPAIDNAPAIQACIDLCPVTQLGSGKYYIGNPSQIAGSICITIEENGKILRGVNTTQDNTNIPNEQATQLIINSGYASGILLGKASNPGGGVPSWVEAAKVESLSIIRNVALYPIINPPVGFVNAPTGLIMQWANLCEVSDVWVKEHSFGFYTTATVACRYYQCRALRYTDGISPGNDFAVGFFQNNDAPSGFNSGNASLYYDHCGFFSNESAGNTYTYNAGLQAYQGFTDTFVTAFETVNTGYGMDFVGRSTTAVDWHTEDLIVDKCVLDGSRFAGIRVSTGGPNSAVQISDCYMGATLATGPSSIGIYVYEMHGSVTIKGCQGIVANGNPATGLLVENSSGVTCIGNIWTNFQDPVRLVNTVGFFLEDTVNQASQGVLTAGVQLTNCQDGNISCGVFSSNPSVTMAAGIVLASTLNTRISIDPTRVIGATITGGSANKVKVNGVQITSPGYYTSAGVAGTSGDGVFVTGITA